MGGLKRASRDARRRTPAINSLLSGPSFTPTQPGDPDFSRSVTPGTQRQFPAATAERGVHENRVRAQNQLDQIALAGFDIERPEYSELRQASRQGFVEERRSLGESLLGWVGAPFETVNLLIQDVIDPDRENASFRDYGNALWGGIENKEEFFEETGFRPESFSETLTMFGWAPNDNEGFQPERILRGITDFGLSVVIDPLTYITGGLAGLGRKTAVATGRRAMAGITDDMLRMIDNGNGLDKFGNIKKSVIDAADVSEYTKKLARTHHETTETFGQTVKKYIDDVAQGNMDSPEVKGLKEWLGEEGIENIGPRWNELALQKRITDDLLRPLNARNFLAIDAEALKELPKWARGGLRLGLPSFSKRFAEVAIEIPHTRGLGRKLIGNPIREISESMTKLSPKYAKVAKAMTNARDNFGVERALLNGMRDGTLSPWQYHISAPAIEAVNNQHFRQTITMSLRSHAKNLEAEAVLAGVSTPEVWRTIRQLMEQVGDDQAVAIQTAEIMKAMRGVDELTGSITVGSPDLDTAIDEAVKFMRETMDELHHKMGILDPNFKEKYVDGYLTHSLNKDGRRIIGQFITRGENVPRQQWVKGIERGEPGLALLARVMNTISGGGAAEVSLGSNRFIDRLIGRVQALMVADDAPLLLADEFLGGLWDAASAGVDVVGPGGRVAGREVLQTRYAGIDQLNDWIGGAVRANADEYGIHMPKDWDGTIFKDNPFEIVADYVGAMDDTIKQWTMVKAARQSGLIVRHSTAIDSQDVLQNISENLWRISEKVDVPGVVGGGPLAAEIKASPGDFIFHGTTARSAKGILKSGFKGGGLAKEAEAAEQFAVSRRTVSGGEDTVLVFRKSDLPPFLRDKDNVSDAFAGLDPEAIPAIKPVGSYKASEGIGSFVPVGGAATTPKGAEVRLLPGRRDLVDGIPLQAIKPMKNAGLDVDDVGGIKELYQTVARASKAEFRAMRIVADDFLPGIVDAGERGLRIEGGDNPTIMFLTEPGITSAERESLTLRAIDDIGEAFMSGDLKGKLNHETMMKLVQNAPNDQTSDLLHQFYRTKMASIGDAGREFLGADPGEFVEITVQADQWLAGANDFIKKYSAKMSRETGELVQGGRQATQLADETSQFAQDLAALHTAARDLSDRGYDEAVDIMRRVDDVTGVVDLKDYIAPHELGLGGPAVEGMKIQKDLGLFLKNVSKNMSVIYTPEGVAAAKLATRELLRTWRALATVARPAFHVRNAVGAAWMNMAVGVRGETYRRLADNTLVWRKALREGLSEADALKRIDPDLQAAWKAMFEEDVLSGFVASEATGRMTIGEKRKRLDWMKVNDPENFVLTRVGGRAMEGIEDIARASLFLEYFDEGVKGSAAAARDMVHAIHFDYSTLTPLETKFKSIIPFFVWTRRNLPRQLEMMVEKPALVQRYKHLMQSMNDNFGGNDENGLPRGDMFSAYAAGTNMYVNPDTPFWARVMIDPDLPTSDLLTIPNLNGPEIADFANNLLGPHIGTLFDINSQREWSDVNSSGTLGTVLKGLAAIGIFDERLDGDVRIPYWLRTVQETVLPFEREVVDPFLGGPNDPNRQQRYGIAQEDNPAVAGLKALFASIGRGFGAKFSTPVDVRATTARSGDEINKIIQDLRERQLAAPRDA